MIVKTPNIQNPTAPGFGLPSLLFLDGLNISPTNLTYRFEKNCSAAIIITIVKVTIIGAQLFRKMLSFCGIKASLGVFFWAR